MFDLQSAGKYGSVKERRCKIAVSAVFVITAAVYIFLVLFMIITKFGVLSPLIKFHDSVAYSYNDSGATVKDPKYSSEYIKEQLQKEYENSPGMILYSIGITGALVIIGQGLSMIVSRKNGKFMFGDHATGVMIDGIFDAVLIVVLLFVHLWRNGFGTMQEIGLSIEPSQIYYWVFLIPLLVLDGLFVSLVNRAAYYEENYQESTAMKLNQRSNVKYCKKCGTVIDNSMIFCENCIKQNEAQNKDINKAGDLMNNETQSQREEPIFSAERADDYIKSIGIKLGISLIISIVPLLVIMFILNEAPEYILSMDGYMSEQDFNRQFDSSVRPWFVAALVIDVIMMLVNIFFDAVRMIQISKTSLCCTNIGIVGNTGNLLGNADVHVPYSDISNAVIVKRKKEYGWISIDTRFGMKYAFFIKNPDSFLRRLKEQIKISQ